MKYALDSEVNGNSCDGQNMSSYSLRELHSNMCNVIQKHFRIITEAYDLSSGQASLRAKVNNSSQIGLGYQQRLQKVAIIHT